MAIYTKGNRIYEVMQTKDGAYGTFFYPTNMDKTQHPEYVEHCSTVHHESAIEAAQERLDEYARKQGFEIYSEEPADSFPLDDESFEEVEENFSLENIESEDEYSAEEIEELIENAEDDSSSDDFIPEITGKRVSLIDGEFSEIIYNLDDKINKALRTAIDAKQGFSVTAKISFVPTGNSFRVKHELGYQFDPIKVKDKGELYDDIQIILDEQGCPIIPENRQHQMRFEDTKGFTVTTDKSGVIENIDMDEDLPFPETYKCDVIDCPLYTGFNGTENGCSFCGNVNAPLDDDTKGSIHEAVTVHNCSRDCILEICSREFPAESEPDFIEPSFTGCCDEVLCNFNDSSQCFFDSTAQYYGALFGYQADEDDIIDTFNGMECLNPLIEAEYNRIKSDVERDNDND